MKTDKINLTIIGAFALSLIVLTTTAQAKSKASNGFVDSKGRTANFVDSKGRGNSFIDSKGNNHPY